jgi:hypothetical protein
MGRAAIYFACPGIKRLRQVFVGLQAFAATGGSPAMT